MRLIRGLGLTLLIGGTTRPAARAQDPATDRSAVLAVIRATFHPQALLASAAVRKGAPVFEVDTVDAFVRADAALDARCATLTRTERLVSTAEEP